MKATGKSDFLKKGIMRLNKFDSNKIVNTARTPKTIDQVTLKSPELKVELEAKFAMRKIDIIGVSFPFDIFKDFKRYIILVN